MASFEFTSHVDEALRELKEKKAEALEIIGGKAESYAKKLCPVDTGNLRNSITHQQSNTTLQIWRVVQPKCVSEDSDSASPW